MILPTPLPLASLSNLIQEISGFFIVEAHVLETTGSFRSSRDVEELWDGLVGRLSDAIENALRTETDPEQFSRIKESLSSFITIVEASSSIYALSTLLNPLRKTYSYSTTSLQSFIIVLFEKYAQLLEGQFTTRFETVCYFLLKFLVI